MRSSTRLTGWRRVAGAMWRPPEDPQIFGALEIDARPVLAQILREHVRGHRLTPMHFVGRAVGHALRAVPELNVRIVRGRAYPRETIDVFFITSVAHGDELAGIKVEDIDHKTVTEVAEELAERSDVVKRSRDRASSRTKRLVDALPPRLLRTALRATAFLTERLQVDVPGLALRRSPFGSAMVTNVGMFGLPQGFAPLAWMYDVPLLVLVGDITDRPVVSAGHVVVRPTLSITTTIDHRFADGGHVGLAMKAFRAYLAEPERFESVD
ncbi:MAG: 2-oxo acid dehydrogenase acyltransferase catalytic domain protein [Myxococcales bacterium]|nr:2-oxo acid dehydrogenase acyltransferase catalytic domain protein [Myxococcales bacterium]